MQLPEPLAGAARGPDRVSALPWASPPRRMPETVKRDKQCKQGSRRVGGGSTASWPEASMAALGALAERWWRLG